MVSGFQEKPATLSQQAPFECLPHPQWQRHPGRLAMQRQKIAFKKRPGERRVSNGPGKDAPACSSARNFPGKVQTGTLSHTWCLGGESKPAKSLSQNFPPSMEGLEEGEKSLEQQLLPASPIKDGGALARIKTFTKHRKMA
jgi:hypothetical protein